MGQGNFFWRSFWSIHHGYNDLKKRFVHQNQSPSNSLTVSSEQVFPSPHLRIFKDSDIQLLSSINFTTNCAITQVDILTAPWQLALRTLRWKYSRLGFSSTYRFNIGLSPLLICSLLQTDIIGLNKKGGDQGRILCKSGIITIFFCCSRF